MFRRQDQLWTGCAQEITLQSSLQMLHRDKEMKNMEEKLRDIEDGLIMSNICAFRNRELKEWEKCFQNDKS